MSSWGLNHSGLVQGCSATSTTIAIFSIFCSDKHIHYNAVFTKLFQCTCVVGLNQ